MTLRRMKLTHPLWRLMETRKCLTLFSPLLVEKEPEYLTHARCFFGMRVHHPCGVLTFWIKSPFLVPTAGLSITGQSHANRTSLDSVTFQKPHTVHHDLGFSMVPLFFFHSFSLSLLSVLCSPSSLWLVIPSPPAHGSALWS